MNLDDDQAVQNVQLADHYGSILELSLPRLSPVLESRDPATHPFASASRRVPCPSAEQLDRADQHAPPSLLRHWWALILVGVQTPSLNTTMFVTL